MVTGDGRPRTQAYLSAGACINPIKWCFFASRLTATADCYRLARPKDRHGRIQVETAHQASLPERPDYRDHRRLVTGPTAKSAPTVIDLDAVKLFLHKRMNEMEVVSHSTQTAKFLLEATLVEHHSGYPVGLGVLSFGMLFPCWAGRGRSL
jgi:hypothetical protein